MIAAWRGWAVLLAVGVLGSSAFGAPAEEPLGPVDVEASDGSPQAERTDAEASDAPEEEPPEDTPAAPSQPEPEAPLTRDAGLTRACVDAMSSPGLRRGGVGLRLVRLSDGVVACDVAGESPRLPASTTKVITAAVALDRLGPDYRFTTQVLGAEDGARQADRWVGDLWVVPSGDPTLDTVRLRTLIDGLRRQGIAHVEGRVVLAAGLHADPPWIPHWPLDDFRSNESYYATLGPLPTDGLRLTATLRPGAAAGAPAIVELSPPQDGFVRVVNRATTSTSAWTRRGSVRRSVSAEGWTLEVSGTIGLEAKPQTLGTWMVDQPDASAAAVVRALLAQAGIVAAEVVTSSEPPPKGVVLSSVASEPLWTVLLPMNKRSSNFLAEMVFRAIAVDAHPDRWGATADDAARAVGEHLARLGVAPEESWVVNGSGLTREHKLSPRALTSVLAAAASDPRYGDEFVASLSVAGVDGTLARRMTSARQGQVRGKTGTLNGVVGLCGTFVGSDGETYVFAALSNDGPSAGTVRAAMDALVTRWIAATAFPIVAEVEATTAPSPAETSSAAADPSRADSP